MANFKKLREQLNPLEIQIPLVSIALAPTWDDINKLLIKPIPGQRGTSVSFGPVQTTKDQSERDADIAQYNAEIVANNAKTAHDYLLGHGNTTFVSPEEYAKWYQYLTPEDKLLAEYKYNGKPGATGIVSTKAEARAKEHNAALKKEQGIANFELALVTGHIRSGKYFEKDLEKYAKEYGISPEEMSQLIAATPDALAYAQQLHSWGQSQTTEKKAKAVEDYTRDVMDKTGRVIVGAVANPAKPVYTAMTYHGDGSGDDLLTHMGYNQAELSDLLKDKGIIQQYSGNNWLAKGLYGIRDFALDIAGNPWTWPMLGEAAVNGTRNAKVLYRNGIERNRAANLTTGNTPKGPRPSGVTVEEAVPGEVNQVLYTTSEVVPSNGGQSSLIVTKDGQVYNAVVDNGAALEMSSAKLLTPNQWLFGNRPFNKNRMRVFDRATGKYTYTDRPSYFIEAGDLAALENYNFFRTHKSTPEGWVKLSSPKSGWIEAKMAEPTVLAITDAKGLIPAAASEAMHEAVAPRIIKAPELLAYLPVHPGKYTPQMRNITIDRYWGSPEFQKAFGEARRAGLDVFTFGGKTYGTKLGNGGTRQFEGKTVMPAGTYTGGSGVFGQTLVSPGGNIAIDPKATVVVSDPYTTTLAPGTDWTGVDLRQLKDGGIISYTQYLK